MKIIAQSETECAGIKRVYRFKHFKWVCFWFFLITSYAFALIFMVATKSGLPAGLIVLGGYGFVVVPIGGIIFLSVTDLVIDDISISRICGGKVLQSIAWEDAEYIRVFAASSPIIRGNVRAFNVVPRRKGKGWAAALKKIFFVENENINLLVADINDKVALKGIEIKDEYLASSNKPWNYQKDA